MVKKITVMVLLSFLFLSTFIIAQNTEFRYSIPEGLEMNYLNYKHSNHSNVIVSTTPSISCSWKPSHLDDGWKNCEAIFEVENLNLVKPIIFNPQINFTFSNNNIRNDVITFSNTFSLVEETYHNLTVDDVEQSYIFTKRQFTNFGAVPHQIDTSEPFAISLRYEAPKYLKNNFYFSVSSLGFSASIDPDQSACGTLVTSGIYNLTQDVSSTGTCFYINGSHITLDCHGFNITYATNNSNSQNGINLVSVGSGFHNNTIRNCEINDITNGGSGQPAIRVDNSNNNSFINNTITTLSTTSRPIQFDNSSDNKLIGNRLLAFGSSSFGIQLSSRSNRNLIRGNNISTRGTNAYGIQLTTTANDFNYIEGNSISTNDAVGILLDDANQTYLINNNISAIRQFEIQDLTPASEKNFLIYNDSFVDLRWVDNGSGSFYENLTTNGTLGLGLSIFFANNTFAFNITEFQFPSPQQSKINSTANITFKGLTIDSINQLRRVDNFTITQNDIFNAGYNCTSSGGISCRIQSYSGGILQFNTTGFSSFTSDSGPDIIPPVVTIISPLNGTTISSIHYFNINISVNEIANVTLNDTRWTLISANDGQYFNFTNNTAIANGAYHLKAYVNDSAKNNGSSDFNFIKETNPLIVTITFPGNGTSVSSIDYYNINISTNQVANVTLNDTRWALIQNTNGVSFNFTNNTALSEGTYHLKAYANDSGGNNGSADFNFIKDATVDCGTVTTSTVLTQDVSSSGTCFTFGASHITLDCNGFNITYSTNNSNSQFSVLVSGYHNTTVRDCEIHNGATSGTTQSAVSLAHANNNTFINNTIVGVTNTNNRVFTLNNASDNHFLNNSGRTHNFNSHGVVLGSGSSRNLVRGNNFSFYEASTGVLLTGGNNDGNYIDSNSFNFFFDSNYFVFRLTNANHTYLINNNVSIHGRWAILDETPEMNVNYLIFNSTDFDIRWQDNGVGSFYRNLTYNGSLGLGINVFGGNNSVSLNWSKQGNGGGTRINSTANITFKGLAFGSINQLKRVENITLSSSDILNAGINCTSTSGLPCQIQSYSSGILQFNTTGFSSFASSADISPVNCGTITKDSTLTQDVSASGTCFYISASHITLECNGFNITYSTNNSNSQNAIKIDGYHNITVRNCEIHNGATSGTTQQAISITNSNNSTFVNNTIVGVTNTNNRVFNLNNASQNSILNNTARTHNFNSHGVTISSGSNLNLVRGNNFSFYEASTGVLITNGNNDGNYIDSNSFNFFLDSNYFVFRLTNANHTYLINNNVSIHGRWAILDETPEQNPNYLIFNSSDFDIRWQDNGAGSFYRNLTYNGSLGLGINVFGGNNSVSLNWTAQGNGGSTRMNSTANITFKGLEFSQINQLVRVENMTTNKSNILNAGYNCSSTGGLLCGIQSYFGGILQFNTSGFSSFTANEATTSSSGINVYNLSLINTNSSFYSAFRFFIRNLDTTQLIDWGFDTNETNIVSNTQTNLTANENIFVFVEHNYTIGVIHTIIANGSSTTASDSEQQQVTIG